MNAMDTHLFKDYCYSGEGLLSVVDKNGCSPDLEYDGGFPVRMATPLAYGIRFAFKDGRLVFIKIEYIRSD